MTAIQVLVQAQVVVQNQAQTQVVVQNQVQAQAVVQNQVQAVVQIMIIIVVIIKIIQNQIDGLIVKDHIVDFLRDSIVKRPCKITLHGCNKKVYEIT